MRTPGHWWPIVLVANSKGIENQMLYFDGPSFSGNSKQIENQRLLCFDSLSFSLQTQNQNESIFNIIFIILYFILLLFYFILFFSFSSFFIFILFYFSDIFL